MEPKQHKETNTLTYWMALVVLVVCNFVISIVLIPFLIILEPVPLYMIIGLLGFMFGSLFKLVLTSIEGLDIKKQSFANFFIPALSVINIAVISTLANKMDDMLQLNVKENPATLGLFYALTFILPFIYLQVYDKIKKYL
jgi:hypothetical protein